MKKSQLRQLIKEEILKENSPGFDTRSSGAPLPTLESVKAAYEAKKDKEPRDGVKSAASKLGMKPSHVKEGNTDTNQEAMYQIFDIIRENGMDAEDVLEEIGQEFGVAFEFNF
tara:strand:+ start:731 stop:1069 length:339 start_codon:yes stop_codon:yes gene_type:complete